MDYADLRSLREVSKLFLTLADDATKNRFKEIEVVFRNIPHFYETEDSITIGNSSTITAFLQNVGHFIHTLSINDPTEFASTEEMETIYRLIEKHCSSLVFLHVFSMGNGFFDKITSPFKSIEHINLINGYSSMEFGNDHLNFNEMFPELRGLSLFYVEAVNIDKILLNYPRLNDLGVVIDECEEPGTCIDERAVIQLFRKNPQIQSLALSFPSENLVKIAADELPMLKQLKLNYYDEEANVFQIHFDHVRTFSILYSTDLPEHITFTNELEEFEIFDQSDQKYLTFIENHRNLKRIKINGQGCIDNFDLTRLASADLEVIDLDLTVDDSIEVETIYQLIRNCKELKRLKLTLGKNHLSVGDDIVPVSAQDLEKLISKKFSSDWNVFRDHANEILVERKLMK